MPNKIDFSFISKLEGGQKLDGYVPAATKSKSGVTIATGFDLGARNESDLLKLSLSPMLIKKLKPYLGMKSITAEQFVKKTPLKITMLEAGTIDKAAKASITKQLIQKYNLAVAIGLKKFDFLPAEAQTVIASVYYQYGNLSTETPKFWVEVTKQDWKAAIALLNNFQDRYPTRRKKEAMLLKKIAP